MDDVTLTDQTERFATLALEGPRAAEVVREVSSVDVATLDELSFCDGSVGSIPCRIVKRSPGGVAGAELIVEQDKVGSLWQILLEAVRKHGGGPMGYRALSALRLEMGVPWFGYDFGEKQIPHEAGLQESHISYTKGCYTGQEIVERVRSRGHANRVRVGLKFSAPVSSAIPQREAMTLFADGKEIGFVTRAEFSPLIEAPIGMGYVRRENSALGTVLGYGDKKAEVISLPLRG
jgi:folate-binding protein YgfZ